MEIAKVALDDGFVMARGNGTRRLVMNIGIAGWFSGAIGLILLGVAVSSAAFAVGSDVLFQVLAWATRSFGSAGAPADLAARYFEALERVVSLRHIDVALPAIFLLLAALLLRGLASGWLSGGRAALWLAAVSAANVIAVGLLYFPLIPASTASDPPASIGFLHGREGRAMALLPDFAIDEALARAQAPTALDEAELESALLFANTNLLYGVASASTFEQIRSADMARLLSLLGDPHAGRGDVRDLTSRSEQLALIASRHRLFDFLGIRWIVSRWPIEALEFREAGRVTVGRLATPLVIYENPTAQAFAYAVPEVQFISSDRVFDAFSQSQFGGIFVACDGECASQRKVYTGGSVVAKRLGNAAVHIKTEFAATGFLVISQNNLPGWRAAIDGRPVAIATVNTVYQGLEVPAGAHAVDLTFSYPCLPERFVACIRGAD